jgi:hypothetical protein
MGLWIRYRKFAPKPLPVPPFGKGRLGGIKCGSQTLYSVGKGVDRKKKKENS